MCSPHAVLLHVAAFIQENVTSLCPELLLILPQSVPDPVAPVAEPQPTPALDKPHKRAAATETAKGREHAAQHRRTHGTRGAEKRLQTAETDARWNFHRLPEIHHEFVERLAALRGNFGGQQSGRFSLAWQQACTERTPAHSCICACGAQS